MKYSDAKPKLLLWFDSGQCVVQVISKYIHFWITAANSILAAAPARITGLLNSPDTITKKGLFLLIFLKVSIKTGTIPAETTKMPENAPFGLI